MSMTVTPIEGEPTRFWVSSDTEPSPWLVDIQPGPEIPPCACAIEHNRTPDRWNCKHVRAARAWVKINRSPAHFSP